jgi:hypothetical protein
MRIIDELLKRKKEHDDQTRRLPGPISSFYELISSDLLKRFAPPPKNCTRVQVSSRQKDTGRPYGPAPI